MNEVTLQSPSGVVYGFVWHLKGAISKEWQKRYWERLDRMPFAAYPGTGERVIRIAAEQVDSVSKATMLFPVPAPASACPSVNNLDSMARLPLFYSQCLSLCTQLG
jgi:hypothetical protein